MISNSLDIDFIHGDIHGQSCKEMNYLPHTVNTTASEDLATQGTRASRAEMLTWFRTGRDSKIKDHDTRQNKWIHDDVIKWKNFPR